MLDPKLDFEWKPISRGDPLPPGAVLAGVTRSDGSVYVGRNLRGVGKLNLDDGKMWNLWVDGGDATQDGEILVLADGVVFEWVPIKEGELVPATALMAGQSTQHGTVYPCRSKDGEAGNLSIDAGKVKGMNYHGRWTTKKVGEILCVRRAQEQQKFGGDGGYTTGSQTFTHFEWRSIRRGDPLPQGVVYAGSPKKDGPVYIGRSSHGVGKLNIDDGKMWNIWVAGGGATQDGEVLVLADGVGFEWTPIKKGERVPANAPLAAYSTTHGMVYPCRDEHGEAGNLSVVEGRVHGLHYHSHFNPREVGEILCVQGIGERCRRTHDTFGGYVADGETPVIVNSMPDFEWRPINRGDPLPSGVVLAGSTKSDGSVYVGKNARGVGKLNVEDGKNGKMWNLWVAGGDATQDGEILVLAEGATFEWRQIKKGESVPTDAIMAGHTKHGLVCPCRSKDGEAGNLTIVAGKVQGMDYHGHLTSKQEGEILCVRGLGRGQQDDQRKLGREVLVAQWGTKWMSALDDSEALTNLTIPGTHDSATFNIEGGTVKMACSVTQMRSILEQLQIGIRFLDLRVAPNGTLVHNFISAQLNLVDAMQVFYEFLQENPQEAIISRVKEEGSQSLFPGEGVDKLMQQCEERFSSMICYLPPDADLPCLGDIRGKVVVVGEWKAEHSRGLTWSSERLHIHDDFSVTSAAAKVAAISAAFKKEAQCVDNAHLRIIFASGTGLAGKNPVLTPLRMARDVNDAIATRLCLDALEGRHGPIGIAVMDFPSEELCMKVVLRNFVAYRGDASTVSCVYDKPNTASGKYIPKPIEWCTKQLDSVRDLVT